MIDSNLFQIVLFVLEVFGVIICAITGAIKAIKYNLDLFGIVVLSSLVGVGGGIMRDIIIGATPVAALENEIYIVACIIVGLIVFLLAPHISSEINLLQYADAISLGVFTFIGAAKAASMGLSLVGIVLSGTITAIGGGIIRDMTIGEIPTVLKSDFYATASIIGGLIFCILNYLHFPVVLAFIVVASVVIALRLIGMSLKIQFPCSHFKDEKIFNKKL